MFYDWVYLHCNRGKNSVKAQISVRLMGRQGKKSKKRRIPMAGEQEWRTKCSTSAMSRVIITRKQENVIGQTEAHQGAPTTAWIVKRRDIQITIILSRSNCSVTRDSGRDCIKDVYISRNQLCSDLPKFLLQIRPHRYRTLLLTTSSVPAKYQTRVTLGPNLVHICIGPRPNFGGSFVHINK